MGGKPRRPAHVVTLSESFDKFMAMANESEEIYDKVFIAAKLGAAYAQGAPVEELTYEQWRRVFSSLQAARQFCDVLLPEVRDKIRTSETIGWMK